mgnify:CR=1 FL=1
MRRYILALALSGASAFLAPLAPAVAKTVVFKKKDKDTAEDAEPVQVNAMSKGTVVEFDLNKHTTLGVIDGHKVKAKGGLRYEIKTSDGKLHAGVAQCGEGALQDQVPRADQGAPEISCQGLVDAGASDLVGVQVLAAMQAA